MDIQALLNSNIGDFTLGGIISAIVTFLVCFVVIKVILKVLAKIFEKTDLDKKVTRVVMTVIKIALYLVAILLTVDSLGVPITSLVALLSVCSLGITLAAEDILGNVAGGLVIYSTKPFNVGDFIEAGGNSGTVKEVTVNHTKIETVDGLTILIPNRSLATGTIINYTLLGRRRVVVKVQASYDASTDSVKKACMDALSMTDKILSEPAASVNLSAYGDSAIEYMIACWANCNDYWTVYISLLENVRKAFDSNGIEMTYDHLNVHILDK